ncbi:uncharacterized protein [Lepeophtheirus salmonis]|uniref:uncharacterized protein isoform X1 n=1 Tax=Lepeophtheirus salmonis TaxID=72036 RepID=UPI001AE99983|nr:transcription initiation factor TFIID subunit 3-like isoform X1 [Lepeophtheirus salmonis]
MNPGDDYAGAVSRLVLGRICLTLGWHGIHKIPLDIMTDMLKLYIQKLGKESLRIAELRSRSHVNLSDVECTIKKNWGSNGGGGSEGWGPEDCPNFLEDYLAVDFNAGSSPLRVPLFPKPAETDLNFLKPGSREVLRRAVYINDYFPPMYPEEEEGDEAGDILIDPATDTQSPESSHHGRDLREISSVIMTSAGFISPARQGKLPDARHPPPPPVIQQEKEVIKSEPAPVKTPEPPPVIKKEKIHSDVSNSKKLAIFQKRTKPKPPEEPLKPPPPPPAHVPPPPIPAVTVKTEPLLTPKKEDHIDEVMNSVIEKGIAESKSLSKKKRKRQSAHIFEEKPLFSSPSSTKSVQSSPAPSTTPTKAKKAKNMVTAPLTVLPEPPKTSLKPPPPKLPSPPPSPPTPIVKPPPPTLLPPPPPIIASSNPVLFPETPPSKPSKKKDSQPKLVLPPPDLLQMAKHEDRPFSNSLIPRGQLYGFGPPVPEVKEKKKDKEKKKHKKEKNKDKDEKKEKKKNKKDKEKKLLLESSSNLLMPDKVIPSHHPPKTATDSSSASSNSSHPKIKIKEIKHEKNIPSSSSSLSSSVAAAPPSSSSLRLSPIPPSIKESISSVGVNSSSKSSSKSSLSTVKPPKLILKPPKDNYDISSSSSATTTTTASKKPKLDKKDFMTTSSSSLSGVAAGVGSLPSSKAEKKAKKSTKIPKEEINLTPIPDATTSSSIGMITTQTVGHYVDAEGNQIWICPACGKQDDGSPMIGCDKCDDWYHWACVGISAEPAENQDWFCTRCMAKKTNFLDKKGKKKY